MTEEPRALVIEDEASWRKLLDRQLQRQGFRVTGADSYEVARTYIEASICEGTPYDLATVDLLLGEPEIYSGAGFALLEQLLAQGTAVVIVTGVASLPLVDEVFKAYGFLGFLKKPWDEQVFAEVIELALRGPRPPSLKERPLGYRERLAALLRGAATQGGSLVGPITWLHLSDLHQRRSNNDENLVHIQNTNVVLDSLLQDLKGLMSDKHLPPDFIVFSGDVAQSGHPEEYELAALFFDKLLEATGLEKDHLFVVPGNHDVDRGVISPQIAEGCLATLTNRDSVTRFLGPGNETRSLAWAKFRGYQQFIADYFGGALPFDTEDYYYVRTLTIRGVEVAILGLNSVWMSGYYRDREGNYSDKGHLLVGAAQVRGALGDPRVQNADVRIALMHHPLDWLQAFDCYEVQALLYDGCEFVLHGHQHRQAIAGLQTPDNSTLVFAAGACYNRREQPNLYNIVQFDLAGRSGTATMRRYSDVGSGFWAADTLTYRNAPGGEYRFRLP
jgi:ActR/RegA family two-component response regulator/predicted phosphodiesterase